MAISTMEVGTAMAAVPAQPLPATRDVFMRVPLDQISPESAADVVRQIVRAEDRLTVDVATFNSAI